MSDKIFQKERVALSKINFSNLRIKFSKDENSKTSVAILGKNLLASYFILNELMQELLEGSFFGKIYIPIIYNIEKGIHYEQLCSMKSQESEKFEFCFEKFDNENLNLEFELQMEPTGNKIININLSDLQINCQSNVLMVLAFFGTMDNSVMPIEPLGKIE